MRKACIILGAGGHARMLIDCIQIVGDVLIAGILDPNPVLHGTNLFDIPILGNDSLLPEICSSGVAYFVVGLGGAGNNRPRVRLFEFALTNGLKPFTVRHPTAIVSSRVKIGSGCQLLPGCIINAGVELGINTIINSGAIVEHDCIISDHVHIATGARLAGTIYVGKGAHVGVGASIRQGVQIGEYAIVGAGAVVVKDVPANTIVAGTPATMLKKTNK